MEDFTVFGNRVLVRPIKDGQGIVEKAGLEIAFQYHAKLYKGTKVMYVPFAGTEIEIEGNEYLVLNTEDLLIRFGKETPDEK